MCLYSCFVTGLFNWNNAMILSAGCGTSRYLQRKRNFIIALSTYSCFYFLVSGQRVYSFLSVFTSFPSGWNNSVACFALVYLDFVPFPFCNGRLFISSESHKHSKSRLTFSLLWPRFHFFLRNHILLTHCSQVAGFHFMLSLISTVIAYKPFFFFLVGIVWKARDDCMELGLPWPHYRTSETQKCSREVGLEDYMIK